MPPSSPSYLHLAAALILIIFAGCATPVPPSGGPVDRTPPEIVSVEPEEGSVNVQSRTVRIEFSEWVDQRSFENALTVTPEPEGRLSFRWRRRTVEISFPEELRPNTTYVLTIDTEFRDFGGARLTSPITIAFSTGPVINRGRIGGEVIGAERGRPAAGIDVYAYSGTSTEAAPPDTLPAQPAYRTQTGTDGRFQFEYLSENPFYVVAVRDANRNRRPDPGEAFAVPPRPWLVADSVGTSPERPWIVTTSDTIAPALTRPRPLSNRRIELRYNEPVILVDRAPDSWTIADSASGQRRPIEQVYSRSADPRSVFLVSESALSQQPHVLTTGAVADSSGNIAAGLQASFTPAGTADTVQVRFVGFVPDTSAVSEGAIELAFEQVPAVRFSAQPSESDLRSWVTVVDTTDARAVTGFVSADGTTYGIEFEPTLGPGESVTVAVQTEGDELTQTFRRLSTSETGEISGAIENGDTPDAPAYVELYERDEPVAPLRTITAAPDGSFVFVGVPEGSYRLRYFLDINQTERWSGGQIAPFSPAEPLGWWNEEVTVRPRWETALPDTLSFWERPRSLSPASPPAE